MYVNFTLSFFYFFYFINLKQIQFLSVIIIFFDNKLSVNK